MKLFLASTVSLSLGLSMPFASARLDGPGPQPRYEYCDHAASLPTPPSGGCYTGTCAGWCPLRYAYNVKPGECKISSEPATCTPDSASAVFPCFKYKCSMFTGDACPVGEGLCGWAYTGDPLTYCVVSDCTP